MARGEVKDISPELEAHSEDYFKGKPGEELPEQGDLFEGEDDLSAIGDILLSTEQATKFEVKAAISIKACRDNAMPQTIPILRGKIPAQYLEECFDISCLAKYFRKQLRAAVGEPSGTLRPQLEEAKTKATNNAAAVGSTEQ